MREAEAQSVGTVMLVRPVAFESNPQTRDSNAFQAQSDAIAPEISNRLAQQQFDGLVAVLRANGVECVVVDDTPEPHTPDAIFPNNWISLHADGRVVLYPMEAANRRTERRQDVIEMLQSEHGFAVTDTLDLSFAESYEQYLEGTGSLVLDRMARVAYGCISTRTHEPLARDWCDKMGYRPMLFEARDAGGLPIYHSNVMMCIGTQFAVVCLSAISPAARSCVLEQLTADGHDVIDISFDAMNAFAGNMLEITNADGERLLAMSAQAEASLTAAQKQQLNAYARIVSAPIEHIETQSGGSVRCMLAEVHLPRTG
ncbi:MAG: arginine deiminase-related protein [Pseudomonadota bacterium]